MSRVIPSLFLLFSLLSVTAAQAAPRPLDSIVAVVNDDVILKSELEEATRQAEQTLRGRNVALPPQNVLEQQVLESLITKHLQKAMAERMNLNVDDRRLRQVLEGIAQRNGLSGIKALKQQLEREGKDYNEFREGIRDEVMVNDLLSRTVRSQVNVSDQEVDNFLASKQAQGELSVEYHLAHIRIDTPKAATSAQIQATRKKAQTLLESLRKGADFARAAVENSQDRYALEGGDMGWVEAAQLPTLFSNVVPDMKKGQISDLIRSSSGFHIIKLMGVRSNSRDAYGADMEQMRQQATQAIQQRKFNEQLEQWLRQLRDDAYVEIRL